MAKKHINPKPLRLQPRNWSEMRYDADPLDSLLVYGVVIRSYRTRWYFVRRVRVVYRHLALLQTRGHR